MSKLSIPKKKSNIYVARAWFKREQDKTESIVAKLQSIDGVAICTPFKNTNHEYELYKHCIAVNCHGDAIHEVVKYLEKCSGLVEVLSSDDKFCPTRRAA